MSIHERFPFDGQTYWPGQKESIDEILNHFETEKYAALEAPTGNGKQLIAYMVAQNYERTIFATPQIILQEQFIKAFVHRSEQFPIAMVCAANNYDCHVTGDSCASGICRRNKFEPELQKECPFHIAKEASIKSRVSALNVAYLLQEANCGVAGSAKFSKADLLVVDEAHTLEDTMRSFCTFEADPDEALKYGITDPIPRQSKDLHETIDRILRWVQKSWVYVDSILDEMKPRLDSLGDRDPRKYSTKDREFLRFHGDMFAYRKNLGRFIENVKVDKGNWVYFMDGKKAIYKPIDLHGFTRKYLFRIAEKVLLLSATFLDEKQYAKSIGMVKKGGVPIVKLFKMQNVIPPENHKIIAISTIGKINAGNVESLMPQIGNYTSQICDLYPNDKGMIHVPSFAFGRMLLDYLQVNNPVAFSRIIHHFDIDRETALDNHLKSTKPTILLSPSFYEGVDLKDDFCRFQILGKLPFPYLGDPIIEKKRSRDPKWYAWRTALKLIQGLGRPVRGPQDYCTSYILDGHIATFRSMNPDLFPSDLIFEYKSSLTGWESAFAS